MGRSHSHRKLKRAAELLIGIPNKDESYPTELPQGYMIQRTKNGHPYLIRTDEFNATDDDAANEHKRVHYPMDVSRETLGEKFGLGVYLYFDFIVFLIWTNVILSIIGIVSFSYHAHFDKFRQQDDSYDKFLYLFYNKKIWANVHSQWEIIGIIQIILVFIFGPIYSIKAKRYIAKKSRESTENQLDLNMHKYALLDDLIKANEHVSQKSRSVRFFFSYLIFLLVLVASAVIEFFLLSISISGISVESIPQASLVISAVIALFIKAMNLIWQNICVRLTRLERHRTWTHFRNNNTLKFFLFKMLNVLTMYASRLLVPVACPLVPRYSSFCAKAAINCDTRTIGVQLFFILVFDLTLQNIWEVVSTKLAKAWKQRKAQEGELSNESFRPQFDVAEEYMELFYRQYIIYLAFPIFPLVGLLGVLCNLVEYRVDKYKLLRICQHPKGMQGSVRNFLTFFLFATAVVALAGPPFGNAWVVSGQASSLCPKTSNSTTDY